jgi:hypothetical protein
MWPFAPHALHLGDDFALGTRTIDTVAGKFLPYHPPPTPGWRYPHLSPQQVWYHIRRRLRKKRLQTSIKAPNKWRSSTPLPTQEESFKIHRNTLKVAAKKTNTKAKPKRHRSVKQWRRRTDYLDLNAQRASELVKLSDPITKQFYKRGDRVYAPRRLEKYRQTCGVCNGPMFVDYSKVHCPYGHQNYDDDEACAPTCHVLLSKCNTCQVKVAHQVRVRSCFVDGDFDYQCQAKQNNYQSSEREQLLVRSSRVRNHITHKPRYSRSVGKSDMSADDLARLELFSRPKPGSRPCRK